MHTSSCTHRARIVLSIGVLTGLLGVPTNAVANVDAFRAKLEKWVETRQILSEEKSDWEVEEQSLRATRELLQQEKEALERSIEVLTKTETVADDERRELLLERGELQRAGRTLDARIREMEARVMDLTVQLPGPLQKKLEPLLVQIPEDPETTTVPLGQRLMNVLGVLAQAEKFNGTATFVAETREIASGQKVQVRTLYWGLGYAVYVDAQGATAGIGRPGPAGWEFSDRPELAARAELLLDIYEGNVDVIDFVELPVVVQRRETGSSEETR